ncbi:MBL fold metallo-hydrolase [Streptomyces sp. NPDC090026]|uniref:MBL fold metallo-hydrolase n=1 Tax=Streptomyces sp. NPDC090026 TaxID=3365923 RepID=UPI00382E0D80
MHDSTAWGCSNCGLIASDGQALLVDTQFTLDATRTLLSAVAETVPGTEITTVVNSHGNGDHTWGNQLLPEAEIVTSASSAAHLCHEMGPEELARLCAQGDTSPVAAYAAQHFGAFDFSGVEVTGPTRTFDGRLEIKVGTTLVELIDLGPGHSAGDVAVHVPEDGIVFTGDALFNGAHMVTWSSSFSGCVAACDMLLATGAETFVPGHGRITYRPGVREIRDRLECIGQAAAAHAAAGIPLEAAARLVCSEYAGDWAHPERLFTAVAAAYQEAGVPGAEDMFSRVAGMAQLANACSAGTTIISRWVRSPSGA